MADLTYSLKMNEITIKKNEEKDNSNLNIQASSDCLIASVVVNLPLNPTSETPYFYNISEELRNKIQIGSIVRIPFGKQELNGYVINVISKNEFKNENINLKTIYEIIYEKIWDEKFIQLAKWISKYYFSSIGTVLSTSVSLDLFDTYTNEALLIKDNFDENSLTEGQKHIVKKLVSSKNKKLSYKALYQKAKFSKGRFYQILNELKNKNIIEVEIKEKKRVRKINTKSNWQEFNTVGENNSERITLNSYQKEAVSTILDSINSNVHKTFVLHGVTGSGKTEVYMSLIEEVIQKHKTAIYLVPEIYLVPQVYQRLCSRFDKASIIVWHSSLTKSERIENWQKILNPEKNNIKIILGARSAILSPIKNLGLVVIDEAHETSFKQSSKSPRYDTIKVAKKRTEIDSCPLILGSATPNIADYFEAEKNKTLIELPVRVKEIPMPQVEVINLRNEIGLKNKNNISLKLKSLLQDTLSRKEQAILLLNRRGYASSVYCKSCGTTVFCKNCSVPVVYHKDTDLMVCHHCGFSKSFKTTYGKNQANCSECKGVNFDYIGQGTQRLEEEIKKLFPEAKTIRVDRDQLQKKDQYIKLWNEFSSGRADILIGTQLVAKGIDLPNVTLVGVILADTMLNFPDYVSYEKAFQLLTQVAGRAGRGEKKGKVLIQCFKEDEQIYNFVKSHDYKTFYKHEIENRKEFLYPPFSSLVRLIFQSFDEGYCLDYANKSLELLNRIVNENNLNKESISLLGIAPCFFSKLNGRFRNHILCKFKNEELIELIFREFFKEMNKNDKVDVIIDIDSVNLL